MGSGDGLADYLAGLGEGWPDPADLLAAEGQWNPGAGHPGPGPFGMAQPLPQVTVAYFPRWELGRRAPLPPPPSAPWPRRVLARLARFVPWWRHGT